jgi:hypothetical protein
VIISGRASQKMVETVRPSYAWIIVVAGREAVLPNAECIIA